MQKQKIDPLFLTLHSDYDTVFCGLFSGKQCLQMVQEPKLTASKNLMVRIVDLLTSQSVSWSDLSFVAVNQGPSPFTTLRVVITTVNGLLFAQNIPLIGVDGLRTFVTSLPHPSSGPIVALLNAFNKDVYYAIKKSDNSIEVGWSFYATFLDTLSKQYANQLTTFMGNAVPLYRDTLLTLFAQVNIPDPLPATVSLDQIAHQALTQWHEGQATREPVLPLYLKTLHYIPST